MFPLTSSSSEGPGKLSELLRPLPVFFLVTLLTGPIYGVPSFQEVVEIFTVFSYGSATVLLHLLLPPATGLLAALGVYLGRPERFSRSKPSGDIISDSAFRTEDRVRAVLRSVHLAIITISPDGEITLKNPVAQSMFQHPSDKGKDPVNGFIDETGLRPLMDRVFKGNSITVEDAVYRSGEGSGSYILKINGIPVLRNEKVVEALLIIEDVTNWKRLEEDLIRSEERYRNIFNHAHCGIFFVDQEGNYLDANPAALEMLGYSRDELLTLNTREISSDSDQRMGKLKSSPGWVVEEIRYLKKDGKIVETELAGTSFRSGDETYFIGIVKDLTRRKQLERQLSEADSKISIILGEMEKALLIFDSGGRVTNASPGAVSLLRKTIDSLTGQSLEDLAPDCDIDLKEATFDDPETATFGGKDGIRVRLKRLPLADPEAEDTVLLLTPVDGDR